MARRTSTRKQPLRSSSSRSTEATSSTPSTDSQTVNGDNSPKKSRRGTTSLPPRGKQKSAPQKEESSNNGRLDRNRLAAARLRERTKEKNSDLEQRKFDLERVHNELWDECDSLVNEIVSLKKTILMHAQCNNANIDQWIQNEAARDKNRPKAS